MKPESQPSMENATSAPPSSDPAPPAHLLPPGEKGSEAFAEYGLDLQRSPKEPPSPPVGEGPGMRGAQPLDTHQRKRSDKSHRQPERRHRGFAKSMRRNPTEAERQMWIILKDRRLVDYKFRRQVPIGPYIADFVCYAARLIVELDGSQHADGHDDARDAALQAKGFTILRIWNNQITDERDAVLDAVWTRLQEPRHG